MINKVLCIDDDTVTQMLCSIQMESTLFCKKVEEALNGQSALDYYEALAKDANGLENAPELILLDLNMPVMGGWEFLEHFATNYPAFAQNVKIYILSSSINPTDKERAGREPLVSGFLSKPLEDAQLEKLKNFWPTKYASNS